MLICRKECPMDSNGNRVNYCTNCTSGCVEKSAVDETFHGILSKVSNELAGTTVSIFDIPNFYNPVVPVQATREQEFYVPGAMPKYSLCDLDSKSSLVVQNNAELFKGYEDNCTRIWKKYIHDSNSNQNPYRIPESDHFSVCGQGIGNLAK